MPSEIAEEAFDETDPQGFLKEPIKQVVTDYEVEIKETRFAQLQKVAAGLVPQQALDDVFEEENPKVALVEAMILIMIDRGTICAKKSLNETANLSNDSPAKKARTSDADVTAETKRQDTILISALKVSRPSDSFVGRVIYKSPLYRTQTNGSAMILKM